MATITILIERVEGGFVATAVDDVGFVAEKYSSIKANAIRGVKEMVKNKLGNDVEFARTEEIGR
jgi:hypothetical protein